MPRAEKTTKEWKKELSKVQERYEQALAKEDHKIGELVRKYYGEDDEVDLVRLEEHFKRVAAYYSKAGQMGKEGGQTSIRKNVSVSVQGNGSEGAGSDVKQDR